MICFIDGVAIDRLVGFEDLEQVDDFKTMTLVRRLIRAGVMQAKNKAEAGRIKIKKGKNADEYEDSGDDDY